MVSRASTSRKTTPYRRSSIRHADSTCASRRAAACPAPSAPRVSAPQTAPPRQDRQAKPTAPKHCGLCRGLPRSSGPAKARFRRGSISTRRLSNPSAFTSPAATSSHSADARPQLARPACESNPPRTSRRARPGTIAPGWPARSGTPLRFASGICRCDRHKSIHSASSRTKNVTGAMLVGTTRRGPRAPFSPSLHKCRMRRNPSPSHCARQPQRIQPSRIVTCDSLRQNRPLPLRRRSLKSFQPAHRLEQSLLARKLPPFAQVLPVEQEPHVDRRRHRLNLFAQRAQRPPVNALQNPPLAPFNLNVRHRFPPGLPSNTPRRIVPVDSSRTICFQTAPAQAPAAPQSRPTSQDRELVTIPVAFSSKCHCYQALPLAFSTFPQRIPHPATAPAANLLVPPRRNTSAPQFQGTCAEPSRLVQPAPAAAKTHPNRGMPHSTTAPPPEPPPARTANRATRARREYPAKLPAAPRQSLPRKPSRLAQYRIRNYAAHLHRACTPLFESRIVQKRIRIRIDQLMRKRRRRRRVHRYAPDAPLVHRSQYRLQAFEIHRFLQHIVHHFLHQRMVRNLNIALDVLEARRSLRKNAGQQIVRANSLHLRRNLLSFLKP